jgi:hypothetical protein
VARLPACTEADFTEYRQQRDWTAGKYAMHAAAMKLPTQSTDGRARCFCGAEIVTGTTARHVIEHHRNATAA